MTRSDRIVKHFQKKSLLTVSDSAYKEQVLTLFDWMVSSDDVKKDVTVKALGLEGEGAAEIICKQDAVIAGIEEVLYCLKQRTGVIVSDAIMDGSHAKKGDVIVRITGAIKDLLRYERIILNILGRMSGIATYTHEFVSIMRSIDNPPLLVSTRKTPWMFLDKKAVCVGGGGTHRLSLSDFPLVKDTHLFAGEGKLLEVVQKMIKTGKFFEIEVGSIEQAYAVINELEKVRYKEAVIMLDNVIPKTAQEFMEIFKVHPFYDHVYIEASGEVTKENLLDWAKTGVDIISSGSLTHSAPACNVSMRLSGRSE